MTKKQTTVPLPQVATPPVVIYEGQAPLDWLKINGDDARRVTDKEQDRALMASIAATGGVLVPLLCTVPQDQDDVSALRPATIRGGHRRYRAAQALGLAMVPIIVFQASTEADVYGLIENEQRQQLELVDKCAAIQTLVAKGHDLAQIKAMLSIGSDKELQKILKIGHLHADIQKQVRAHTIELDTALALTAWPPEEQLKVLKAAGGKNADDYRIRQLLGEGVPVEYALFAHDAYKGLITEDLFSNRNDTVRGQVSGRRFADKAQFMNLQNEALRHLMNEDRNAGKLVYLFDRMAFKNGHEWQVNKHEAKSKVPPATIYELNSDTGYVQRTENAQLRTWSGAVLNPETGEIIASKTAKAELKAKEKAKDLPPEDRAPFTKTGADGLKRQLAVAMAGQVAKSPHVAMAIATVALLDGHYDVPEGREPVSTIRSGNSWPIGTMQNADKKSPEGKAFLPVLEALTEQTKPIAKLTFDKVLALTPAQLQRLFAAAVALTMEIDHYGNAPGPEWDALMRFVEMNPGEAILYDDHFRGAISKAGCIQWMKLLGMIGKGSDHEKMNRTQLLNAIEKRFGSLEKAGRTALPPLTGVAQID